MSQITVIVPVYKVEPYLRRCVDSILSQTFTDFDLILIDDGSPDQCGSICDGYAAQDQRVHVIHHKENQGLSAARNSGIDWAMEHSVSEWITFIDSDDWVASVYLSALYDVAQKYGIAISTRRFFRSIQQPEAIDACSFTQWKTEAFYRHDFSNGVVAWGKLFQKNLFSTVRFPIGKIHEDAYIIPELVFNYEYVPVSTIPLYYYLIRQNSLTHKKWNPTRLDELESILTHEAYFIKNDYEDLAKARFKYFFELSSMARSHIANDSDFSDSEKKSLMAKVRKYERKMLILCGKFKWCSPWNRGEDLWRYSNAFLSIHIIHMVWRKIKYSLFTKTD